MGNRFWRKLGLGIFIALLLISVLQLFISKPGDEIVGCGQGCADVGLKTRPFITIVSLNMLHEYPEFEFLPERLDALSAELQALDVDIVLLQEVPWIRGRENASQQLASQLSMNHLYFRANGNRSLIGFEEGSAILSRFPLVSESATDLQPKASFFENRIVLHAVAKTSQGDLDLFVTHLTNKNDEINRVQAESLLEYVADMASNTAVIAGDFNATENSPQIQLLSENWIDLYQQENPDNPGLTCCFDDLDETAVSTLSERVDYIFLMPGPNQGMPVYEVERLFTTPYWIGDNEIWLSDHVGLMVKLAVEP